MNYQSVFLSASEIATQLQSWSDKDWNNILYPGIQTMDYRPVDQVEVEWLNAIRKEDHVEWPYLDVERIVMERSFDSATRRFLEPQSISKNVRIQAANFHYDGSYSFTIWGAIPLKMGDAIKNKNRLSIFITDSSLNPSGVMTFRQWDQQMQKHLKLMQLSMIGKSDWIGLARALNEKDILQTTIQIDIQKIEEQRKKQKRI